MEMVRTGQLDVIPIGSDAVQLDAKWAVFDMPFLIPDREVAHARSWTARSASSSSNRCARAPICRCWASARSAFATSPTTSGRWSRRRTSQGLKLRTPGSKTRILAFEKLGATPVTMNIGELYLALQQGTVDGQENPLGNIKAFSWNEVQKYLSLSSHVYTPITLVMNGERWDGSARRAEGGGRAGPRPRRSSTAAQFGADNDATLLDELSQEHGGQRDRLAAFQEASKPIWDEIAPIAGEEFTQAVIAATKS